MNENEILKNETLSNIIQRGVAIREQRIAEERARIAAMEEMRNHDRASILELLPLPLAECAHVDVFSYHAYVRIKSPFPRAGNLKIIAQKDKHGQWSLCGYEALNPDGYYLRLSTLEEAVAYAAGALEV